MTVREFLRTVWDGKWFVLAAVVVVMGAALVYLNREVTVYQATASVTLATSDSGTGGGSGGGSTVSVNSDPTIVTSTDVTVPAAKKLGYSDPSQIAATVTTSFDGTSNSMYIVAESSDPAYAAKVANAYAKAYVAYLPKVVAAQVATIDQRLSVLSDQLDAANKTLVTSPKNPIAGPTKTAITKQIAAYADQKVSYASLNPAGIIGSTANGATPLGIGHSSVMLISFLAGLAAGIGLAFARRGLDFRVRTPAQAAEITNAPLLAEIDGVKRALKDTHHEGQLPVASRVATPYTESIRELRTAVQVSVSDKDSLSVVVTAADPSAPRSFITANLAASWALSGRKTIVMSADMRRPELDAILPAPDDWDGDPHTLRPTQVANLSVFPVPDQPLDPADFLATSEARDLVRSLAAQADILVIDAPPVLAAADATILGSYADGVVLIASVGKTDRAVLAEAADRLRVNHVNLAGLAVAGVTGDRRMAYAATYGDAAEAAQHAHTSEPDAAPAPREEAAASPRASAGESTEKSTEKTASRKAPVIVGAGDPDPETQSGPPVGREVETSVATAPAVETREPSAAPKEAEQSAPTQRPLDHRPAAQRPAAQQPTAVPPGERRDRPAPGGGVRTVAPSLRPGSARPQPAWSPVQSAAHGGVAVEDDTTDTPQDA